MAVTTRLIKSLSRLLFPIVLLLVIATAAASVWLVFKATHPTSAKYLVTPEKYGQLSSRAAQVTEETWNNPDGTTARGWLLRGAENAPGVILFHKYGADRSYELNLGVKLNESTNFTVLMPDLRAHGENSSGKNSTFGGNEAGDAFAVVEFLRNLKTTTQITLVGKDIGVYGIEFGGTLALVASVKDQSVKAIALDSVPADSDQLLSQIITQRYQFASVLTSQLARLGTHLYFYDGSYRRETACETAKKIEDRNVLLLGGIDAAVYQDSMLKLSKCFPANDKIVSELGLSPSGFSIINASMEQSESYDQRLIDFFRNSLTN